MCPNNKIPQEEICFWCAQKVDSISVSTDNKESKFQVKMLLHYLKVNPYSFGNLGENANIGSRRFPFGDDLFEQIEHHSVQLCAGCATTTKEFASLYLKWDLARIQIDNCLKKIFWLLKVTDHAIHDKSLTDDIIRACNSKPETVKSSKNKRPTTGTVTKRRIKKNKASSFSQTSKSKLIKSKDAATTKSLVSQTVKRKTRKIQIKNSSDATPFDATSSSNTFTPIKNLQFCIYCHKKLSCNERVHRHMLKLHKSLHFSKVLGDQDKTLYSGDQIDKALATCFGQCLSTNSQYNTNYSCKFCEIMYFELRDIQEHVFYRHTQDVHNILQGKNHIIELSSNLEVNE